jgi:hypothetical protein
LTILHHRAGTCRLAGSRLAPAGTILETLLLHAVPDAGLGLHHAITVLQHLLLHHPLVEHLLLQHLLLHCSELTAVPVLAGPGNVSHALLATDVASGDGARIRTAFTAYHGWRSGNPGGTPLSTATNAMHNALSATYVNATHRTQLVNRIIAVYDDRLNRGLPVVPQDDQQVLDFLGIRQQCVEWANASVAMLAGGNYRGHGSTAISDVTQIRPGMGLSSGTHFMVSTWSDPIGQRPWERSIGSREFNVAGLIGSTYRVISFE